MLNLLSLPVLEWPQRAVLDAWRSPYFDWTEILQAAGGLFDTLEQAASRLDEVARWNRIVGGLEQWREALASRAKVSERDDAAKDEDRALREGPVGEEAGALLQMFNRFVEIAQPDEQASLEEHIAFVENLIGEDPASEDRDQLPEVASRHSQLATRNPQSVIRNLNIVTQARANKTTTDRDVAALQAFKDVLRGLLLAETITASLPAGSTSELVTYRRFYSELRGAVEAASYRLPRPKQGAILAASVLQARGVSFRAVALLGLSEGEFPQQEREDPLLRDNERARLAERGAALRLRLLGDEITLFYEAVTRAREHLLLTRPYLSDDGQPWEPSPYWQEVMRLLDVQPARADANAVPASIPEYLAVAGEQAAEQRPDLAEAWSQVQHTAAILEARQARHATGAFEGDLAAITARLQQHFPADHVWSSSRLEAYAVCPFQFFVRHGLDLEPRVEAEEGFDVLILGSIYHEALENIYRQARDQGDWSQEALLALLPVVASPIFDAAPRHYGFRPSPLWEYQCQELLAVLARNLAGLSEMAADDAPLALEAAFGLQDRPSLEVSTEEGSLRLRGYIDRIDQAPDGRLRIIDYKSGSTAIRSQDLTEGKRIQLPLYALAAEQALEMGKVSGGVYWHLGSAKASQLKLEKYGDGVHDAAVTAVAYAVNYARGIRAGRYPPRPPAKCPQSCPATAFCWRYRS